MQLFNTEGGTHILVWPIPWHTPTHVTSKVQGWNPLDPSYCPQHIAHSITVLEGRATSAGGEAGVSLPQTMPSVWVHLKFSETEGLGVGRMDQRTRTIANVTLSIKNTEWVSYRLSSGWHCAKFWWMRSAESQKCPDSCKSSRTQE